MNSQVVHFTPQVRSRPRWGRLARLREVSEIAKVTTHIELEIVSGVMAGQAFSFDGHDTFLFGRGKDCHARLPDDDRYVSRHHFLLETNPPAARIRDLGSLNGTFVNGIRLGRESESRSLDEEVHPHVDLDHGDEIRVGATRLQIRVLQAEPTNTAPADFKQKPTSTGKDQSGIAGDEFQGIKDLIDGALCDSTKSHAQWPCIEGYEIERCVGQGGMGLVYLARNPEGDPVAIKFMQSQIAADAAARRIFLREIDIVQKLRHANVVSLVERGATGNSFYFVMDYCNRGCVRQLSNESGAGKVRQLAIQIIVDALAGLDYGHRQGFVHRDIKPSNILLHEIDGELQAKIGDFGLAKSYIESGLSGLTATGNFAGTLDFMAREQLTNFRNVQPVSDVWSMAATLYWMLTGHAPRERHRDQEPINVVLQAAAVPIRERVPDLPVSLAKVIDRALTAEPSHRYRDGGQFRDALVRAAEL